MKKSVCSDNSIKLYGLSFIVILIGVLGLLMFGLVKIKQEETLNESAEYLKDIKQFNVFIEDFEGSAAKTKYESSVGNAMNDGVVELDEYVMIIRAYRKLLNHHSDEQNIEIARLMNELEDK